MPRENEALRRGKREALARLQKLRKARIGAETVRRGGSAVTPSANRDA
jgi:hypothetical protein